MKLYCAVKIGPVHETKVREYLAKFSGYTVLKATPEDRLHVTTAFLGEMDTPAAIAVLEAVKGVAAFNAFLGESMSFGPKVVVLRAYGSGLNILNRIHGEKFEDLTGKRMQGMKYVPHLTIAKAEEGSGSWHEANRGVEVLSYSPTMDFKVESVGLYHKAELIHEVKLRGATSI